MPDDAMFATDSSPSRRSGTRGGVSYAADAPLPPQYTRHPRGCGRSPAVLRGVSSLPVGRALQLREPDTLQLPPKRPVEHRGQQRIQLGRCLVLLALKLAHSILHASDLIRDLPLVTQ